MILPVRHKDGTVDIVLYDEEDADIVMKHHWFSGRKGNTSYVWAVENKEAIYLHRLVMHAPLELTVDHINGNGLDNRKCNLRCVPLWVNLHNGKPRQKRAAISSRYKGVCWRESKKRWRSYIYVHGKCIELGLCRTEEEAHRRQVKAEKALIHGTATGRLSSGEEEE